MKRTYFRWLPAVALSGAVLYGVLGAPSRQQPARASSEPDQRPDLIVVQINPEARVKAERGPTSPTLTPGVWRSYPVRFENEARVTAVPRIYSPNCPSGTARERWLDMRLEPAGTPLTGVSVEYRTLYLRSRDGGLREATFSFDVGQGTQDIGFRGEVALLFRCAAERD